MTNRKNWSVGASSCVLSNFGGHTDEGFSHYKKAGIKYAELSRSHDMLCELDFYEHPEKILEIAKRNDVEFWSFHAPFYPGPINPANLDENDNKWAMDILEKSIRAALKIDIKTIVIHPSTWSKDDDTRQARIEKSIKNMRHLAKICTEGGAVLAVEDLPSAFLGSNSFEIITFLNEIPKLSLCFDTNHLTTQTNEDFLDDLIVHRMHGRIRTLHVSDYDFIDERHRLPGDGINDWKTIIQKLEELDYNGVFMYEVSKPKERDAISPMDIKENFESLIC